MATTPAVKPYKVNVPQSKIDTLHKKLDIAEFPDELEGSGWDLGAPLADVKRLSNAWRQWDWRAAEQKLNEVSQEVSPYATDNGRIHT